MSDMPASHDQLSLIPDAVLEMIFQDAIPGSLCALLVPAMQSKMRGLQAGQILEVQVGDPAAQEDIASWCRLTGHELLLAAKAADQQLHFFIRKKINS